MALVLLNCGMNGNYLLSVPPQIAEDIYRYKAEFIDWLYNPETEHNYWKSVDEDFGSFRAVEYDANTAFPLWLNENVLKDSDEKAVCLPRLDF